MAVSLQVEDQLRECYARVAWTNKVQEKCADKLIDQNRNIQLWQIGLSAVTTSGLIGTIFGECILTTVVAAIASTLLLVLNAYAKNRNLAEIAHQHSVSAVQLWNIREAYLSLLVDYKNGMADEMKVLNKRDELQEKLSVIYKEMPRGFRSAYADASKALKVNEELTLHDQEIDGMLPKSLRRTHVD